MNSEKLQELQILEQNLSAFISQKQTSQIELNEVENALNEINNSPNELYKIVGNIMVKANPVDLKKELDEKKKILSLRVSSLEKQERIIEQKSSELRDELTSSAEKDENH